MKVIGEYRAQNQFIFAITSGFMKSRVDIYSYYSKDDTNDSKLIPEVLNTKRVEPYAEYLVASAVITKTGTVTKLWGNLAIVSAILRHLKDAGYLIDIVAGSVELGEYSTSFCRFTITTVNEYISAAEPLKGIQYSALNTKVTFDTVVAGVAKKSLKTFDEVVKTHDMSWYYDDRGNCKKDYRLVQNLAELKELIEDAWQYEYIAMDTETTGTDFYWYKGDASRRSQICGMSLSWKRDQGIYIPFMSVIFTTLNLSDVMEIVLPLLRSKQVVCHNGMFDFKVFYSYGYKVPIAQDTLLMEFNIDPHVKKGSKGLKVLTRKYLNHDTIELDELTGGRVIPELIPYIDSELIKVYGCSDTDYTLQIFELLKPTVISRQSYRLDCKLIEILAVAEYQGTPIDMQLLGIMSQINQRDLEIVEGVMNRYLRIVGTQALAVKAFKGVEGANYEPSFDEIQRLCQHQPFLDSIEGAFYKQKKKKSEEREPLQFSSSADVVYILYDLLGYPVLKTTMDGGRTSDKEALDKLLDVNATSPVQFMKEDIVTSAPEFGVNSHSVLISKKKFEGYQYPFVYLLSTWRELSKLATSFFGPLQAGSSIGYFFSDNSMTSAETSRVINKIQTLKGSLKNLAIPRTDEWYMIVFDKSQIEFRVMLGLAANYWHGLVESGVMAGEAGRIAKSKELHGLIENLNDWEKDYHREGGAIFAGCTPDTMSKEQRKKVKAIHFSVPYGAEAASVAKPKLRGVPESKHSEIIAETESELAAWRNKLYPLYYFLEHVRDVALTPIAVNPPGHVGTYGKVTNAFGRYRLFNLDDLSFSEKRAIRRQAGNYPIQSLARDIFFTGVLRLYNRLKQEGIICDKFEDSKAVLSLFVHDEVVLQVHKSIHPYRMYKYIMETNLTKLKGHPTYFMGIAVANNWGQGKSDKYEAPIDYVNDCIAKYDSNREYYDTIADSINLAEADYCAEAMDGITEWFAKRVCRELDKILGGRKVVDPAYIEKHLINYYVKPRLEYYSEPCRKQEYMNDPSSSESAQRITQLLDYYLLVTGEYKNYSLLFNGNEIPYSEILLIDRDTNVVSGDFDLDFDLDEMSDFDEDYTEKENKYADEYYLLQESEVHINKSYDLENVEPQKDQPEIPRLWGEDTEGNIVFFVSSLSKQQFNRLVKFLHKYISVDGKKLYFFSSNKVYSGVSIRTDFTPQQVHDAVFAEAETNVFGA